MFEHKNWFKQYVLKQRRICLQGSTSLISSLANSTYELRLLQGTLYSLSWITERSSCERRPQVDHGLIGYLWRRWLGVIVKSWLEIWCRSLYVGSMIVIFIKLNPWTDHCKVPWVDSQEDKDCDLCGKSWLEIWCGSWNHY